MRNIPIEDASVLHKCKKCSNLFIYVYSHRVVKVDFVCAKIYTSNDNAY